MTASEQNYRLEFATGVWRDVGILPRQAYDRITSELREIARRAARLESESTCRLDVGELTAVYEVNHEARMVVVLELLRRSANG